jgi:hypothetical protein
VAHSAVAEPITDQKIQQLVTLLDDPDVRAWLEARKSGPPRTAVVAKALGFATWEASIRARINGIMSAVPQVPRELHNMAMTEEHEMVLVQLKSADQPIPVLKGKHRIDEKKLKSLGEVSDLKPGADGKLKATLTRGSYLLFCNISGHYEAGMHIALTVTE